MAGVTGQSGLVLLDSRTGRAMPAKWAGQLIGLGARLARRRQRNGWQLVMVVSVPIRDYAALLISAGWVLAQPPTCKGDVLALAGAIQPGTPARMATAQQLVADTFFRIDQSHGEARIHLGGTFWKIGAVHHLAADQTLSAGRFGRRSVTPPGSLIRKTGHGDSWPGDLCASKPTVTVVGVQSRLAPELEMQAGWAGCEGGYDRLRDVLRPDDGAFSASAIVSGGRDRFPVMPADTLLAVLDGATAIRWLSEVRTPVVVAVIDRSSADESAAMTVLQRRSIGEPLAVADLGWGAIAGIETLAFEVKI
ncbi:hypothetical protein [Micromonospora sp. NPDC048830]|uniref:hypothetical protein n=1 Tax=Micromonospora sp. NPDC048830 TaxID=3364257 RepID=UPI00371D999F